MRPAELEIQRQITAKFIELDSTPIAFVRTPKVSNGSGGYIKGAPTTLRAQQAKVSWQQDTAVTRETEDGRDAAVAAVLVLPYDADVQRWDTFTMNGDRFEVVFVKDFGYEIKAEVIRRGQ